MAAMKPMNPPTSARCVLSFDFDGTLHHPGDDPPVPAGFFEWLVRWREDRGVIWGINTGRSLPQLIDGIIESAFPFSPDWVVTRERDIHLANEFGRLIPHAAWNKRCDKETNRLFRRARGFLRAAKQEIRERTGAEWIEIPDEPAGLIARTDEEMDWIATRLTEMQPPKDVGWQRNSIYLRFGHAGIHKGSALGEAAALYHLDASACFAVGDGHNDLEMLDPRHAGFIACPANAVEEVRTKVGAYGGYIAGAPHAAGVLEALTACFDAGFPGGD
jgi:HAD superfamily hydrolase (TIGR01484 family)